MENNTQDITNWLESEANKLSEPNQYEELPSLKLAENVVTEIEVDFSNPFKDYSEKDEKGTVLKTTKIIPVIVKGVRMNFWLNVRNPIYRELINLGKTGVKTFKVLRTGSQKSTKYVLVK